MKSKECFKCNQVKSISEFYKHAQMADGHVNKCKECNKKDVSLNYRGKIDYYKEYDKKRNKRPHRKQFNINACKKKRAAYPQKYKAYNAVNKSVISGKLIKQPCVMCDDKNVHGHHDDYSKPLDVVWLCPRHHAWLHRALKTFLI